MNYLGHLFFSNNDLELMHANLLGDFIKGNDWKKLPDVLAKGVLLHRSIDSFIDHHEVVLELKKTLYSELPKVAGIAIDLYFDHLLARKWMNFHSSPLSDFLENFYTHESIYLDFYTMEFNYFLHQLKKYRWINQYATSEGLDRLCQGVSQKISFPNQLNQAPGIFKRNEEKIITAFESFMNDAITKYP